MAGTVKWSEKLKGTLQHQREQYAQGEDRPLGGYTAAMSVYGGMVAALAGAAWLTGREPPERIGPWDAAMAAVATHKLSRLIAKDSITSPLRAPFTVYEGVSGPGELSEDVRGRGKQKAVGELISCPFCIGMWIATGFTAGYVFLPRCTRLATVTLAALAGSDFLQFAYAYAEQASQG